jgi:curved DNA-binding protein CbpA
MSQDFYRILGVPRSATKEQIRNAYLSLARKYHPDVNQGMENGEQLKEVNQAYGILSDDESRAAYNLAIMDSDPNPLERTSKLYPLKSVAAACAVTAALSTSLGYSLTFIQTKPEPIAMVSPKEADPEVIERKVLEKALELIKEAPSSPISSVSSVSSVEPVKQNSIRIPITATLIMDRKRPLSFVPSTEVFDSSSLQKLTALKSFRSASKKRVRSVSKRSTIRKSSAATQTNTAQSPLSSKLKTTKSPSIKVGSSPEAILSTISILMEDGSSVPADTLLKVDPQVWKLNHGLYRKKLSKFISALVEFKDVARASKKSGLSLSEIRYLIQQA